MSFYSWCGDIDMRRALLLLMAVILLTGCEEPTSNMSTPKPGPPQPPQPPGAQKADAQQEQQQQKTELVKAEAGVGKKGQRLEKKGLVRMMTVPALAFFRTEQRVVFEIQIPHALNLYKALHGDFPKTQEEFMKEIVKANQLDLPELPAGNRYVYDPEKGELLVERPVPE
jgi:hypothetical protein